MQGQPRRQHIALMGGSYNPVHIGHLMVADYVRQAADIDEVLMTVSPLNPLKVDNTELAADSDRMVMLEIATKNFSGITPCGIELTMPRPSYTIDTLNALSERYPDAKISIIIGSDNWLVFDRWRASEEIIARFGVIIYPRPGYDIDRASLPKNVSVVDAPTVDLSSTFLRQKLSEGFDMSTFLPTGVFNYIKTKKLYGTT